jgi:transcriptional regulator with XRE-family HTH domain
MTFGERLRALRTEAGLSPSALAAKSGVPVNALHGYEKGHALPTLGGIQRLAKALGVSLGTFEDVWLPEDARRAAVQV